MRATGQGFEASGDEAVEALLCQGYLTRLQGRDQRCDLRVTSRAVGPLAIGRARFDMVADLQGGGLAVVGIARARAGRLSYSYGSEESRWTTGDVFVAVEPASEYVLHVEHADVDHTMIDLAVFAQVAEPSPGEGLRLTSHAPVSPAAARRWLQTWELLAALTQDGLEPVPDLVVGQASRLLAAVTLATFPNNAVTEPSAGDRRDARPVALQRALSFAEAHLHLDVTVVDLAQAAHVSPRALQLAFRRHLGVTPTGYLRRLRLERAHADLRAAEPERTTVAAIAARWGFANVSRFAAEHRAAYGQPPGQTLRS